MSNSNFEYTNQVDAFILFNEQEITVESVVYDLDKAGVVTHFFRRDIDLGESMSFDEEQLNAARTVVLFLGEKGWGISHLKLTQVAQRAGKRIIPVLIGDPPNGALAEAQELFIKKRYLDLRQNSPKNLQLLVEAIRSNFQDNSLQSDVISKQDEVTPPLFRNYIAAFINGNTEVRSNTLDEVIESETIDKVAFGYFLRREIEFYFGPESRSSRMTARRDPSEIPSIRSWLLSALICVDGETQSSRDLILRHLDSNFESHPFTRFWILASLSYQNSSYLSTAANIAESDTAIEVSTLATVLTAPDEVTTLQLLKSQLEKSGERSWPALRALRIVAVPELADDVFVLFEKSEPRSTVSYDSLYALSNPGMATQIAHKFQSLDPLQWLISRVIEECLDAHKNAVRSFSRLLYIVGRTQIESLLERERTTSAHKEAISDILSNIRRYGEQAAGSSHYNAGFSSDTIDVNKDSLGVRREARTFAAVMLSREVSPPLAIGLFGGWGSGKSFFMQVMKDEIEKFTSIAKGKSDSKFCTKIVQLEFNAWHYADINILANLVKHIFDGLHNHISPPVTEQDKERELEIEKEKRHSEIDAAERREHDAHNKIIVVRQELVLLETARITTSVSLKEFSTDDFKALLKSQPDIEASLKTMGLPAALSSYSDMSTVVSEIYTVRGRLFAWFIALTKDVNRTTLIILIATLLIIPFVAQLLIHFCKVNPTVSALAGIVSQGVISFSLLAGRIKQAWKQVEEGINKVGAARSEVEKLLEKKRFKESQEEIELKQKISELEKEIEGATETLRKSSERLSAIDREIHDLHESGSLKTFIANRKTSNDYNQHLGLTALVRRDFEVLRDRLSKNPEIERIVLYIDDLDRCSEETVMQVLQAVHLFLAYPLFVVVVGVDPRWLRHALKTSYPVFGGQHETITAAGSTPQDYLEKIFQIPFNLRSMSNDGYAKLVTGLLRPDHDSIQQTHSKIDSNIESPANGQIGPDSAGINNIINSDSTKSGDDISSPSELASEPLIPELPSDKEPTDYEELLVIQLWEARFAELLFPLIPTPRSAKRFVNVYRLLKAHLGRSTLLQFEGTAQRPGDFQVPMLLLAIVIRNPQIANEFFSRLYMESKGGEDMRFRLLNFSSMGLQSNAMKDLEVTIHPIVSETTFPTDCHIFEEWIPWVSRFSFN